MLCKKIELMMLEVGSLAECLRTAFMLLKDMALLGEYPGTGLQAHTHRNKHTRSWDSSTTRLKFPAGSLLYSPGNLLGNPKKAL